MRTDARRLSENRNRHEKVGWLAQFACEFEAHSETMQRGFGAKWDATTAFAVGSSIVGQPPRLVFFANRNVQINCGSRLCSRLLPCKSAIVSLLIRINRLLKNP